MFEAGAQGRDGNFLQLLSGHSNSLGCLHNPFSEVKICLTLGFGQRKG